MAAIQSPKTVNVISKDIDKLIEVNKSSLVFSFSSHKKEDVPPVRMPLIINGGVLEDIPSNTRTLFEAYPHFKEIAAALVAQPLKVIGPVSQLYVGQREYAISHPQDKHISIIGSDDATTCHIAVIRHSGSGVVCLGHFDGSEVDEGLTNILRRIQELSPGVTEGRFEVQIVGGFLDTHLYSEQISMQLLRALHKQPLELHLITICTCAFFMNNAQFYLTCYLDSAPTLCYLDFFKLQNYRIYRRVNIGSGEIFPATFPDKGPDLPLRSARHLTGGYQMLDIYDCAMGLLRIGPFHYDPMRGTDLWLSQSDEFIVQHLSTSPEAEPPHFVMHLRETLKYIQQHPFPGVTVFPDNRPHFFQKEENGQWLPVPYAY
ncbi:Protein N-terminal asparagine amidohydrolase [Nymphon striatum]|nr:Protein N-terminal asparagine amidohydrolase [Nymphon striatum]